MDRNGSLFTNASKQQIFNYATCGLAESRGTLGFGRFDPFIPVVCDIPETVLRGLFPLIYMDLMLHNNIVLPDVFGL